MSLEINFNSFRQEFSLYWKSFLASETGKVYVIILWDDLWDILKSGKNKKPGNSPASM